MIELPEAGEAVEVPLGESANGSQHGATLIIEPGDLALEDGAGDTVSGAVEIRHIVWDPAVDSEASYPGNLFTATEVLTSYGMADIDFFVNGAPANVKTGQTIGMKWNVNPELMSGLQDALNAENVFSYTLNHDSGLWELDNSVLSLDDEGILNYEKEHFSPANVDVPAPPPCREAGQACGAPGCCGSLTCNANGVCADCAVRGDSCGSKPCCFPADDICITNEAGNGQACLPAQ